VAVPIVAIVGRPNVGKSSLFNWLAGRRISIVDPTAGVTRDRVSTLIHADDRRFELIDTGGMGIQDCDNLTADVERQIGAALALADVILFVVDVRTGVVPLDEEVSQRLRHVTKPVLVVANKADSPELDTQAVEFYRLGRGTPTCVSAEQKRGRTELVDRILRHLPPPSPEEEAPPPVELKLAIVGRRNTGKSTFINSLAQADRVIVSEVPGTTRDSVDVRFERDGKSFVAIDTAGVRRAKSIASDIEFYSLARAQRSIRRADVVLLFFDARLRISKVDKQLAQYVLEEHKPAIFVVNKWDLVKQAMPTEKMGNYVRAVFPMLEYVPIAFITAKSGKNVQALLNLAQQLHKQATARVGTGDLNRVVRQALEQQPPPLRHNRRAKVYYATQAESSPPTIVLFTNGPELFDNTYQRYLIKYFRDHLPFGEVPIKLVLRAKKRDEAAPVDDDADTVVMDGDAADAAPSPPSKGRKRPKPTDVTDLEFRSDVTDEEFERNKQQYDSELWNI
jgi:GTP-binding protein